MGMETMVAHTNSPTDTDPVQDNRYHHRLPSRIKNGRHRQNVKTHHRGQRDSVNLRLVAEINVANAQFNLFSEPNFRNSLTGRTLWKKNQNVIVM
jgi:hypothetical protein